MLLILVPGAGIRPADFHDQGLVVAAQTGACVSVQVVDPGIDSYLDGSAAARLLAGIAGAQAACGATAIWLAGISLGCQAILHGVRMAPGLAAGLILVTPYLASSGLVAQIGQAGGLRSWAAAPAVADAAPDNVLLRWLARAPLPPTLLGYARSDRFVAHAMLLAERLPPAQVAAIAGGHDWQSWRALWPLLLERTPFAAAAG